MATNIQVAVTSGNHAKTKATTTDRNRKALAGCIGEWDMQTFDGVNPKLMPDQSIAGNDFLFINTPTTSAQGVVFDGANYADMTLPAALLDNYSLVLVMLPPVDNGFYAFGSQNTTVDVGCTVRAISERLDFQRSNSNLAQGPVANTSTWGALLATVEDGQGRARPLGGGRLQTNHSIVASADDTRTLWRLGARAKTVDGDDTVPDLIMPAGTVAYAMLFDRVVGFEQSFSLHAYIQEQISARGIII